MTLPTPLKSPRPPAGFTLIEILVVIAILVILVGLVVAIGSNVQGKAKIQTTKTLLKTLDGILSQYQQETGVALTPTGPGDNISFIPLFAALPQTQKAMASLKPYLNPANSSQINDAFGTPIIIVVVGTKPGFQSAGPDRQFGTLDDIYSWEP